MPGITIVKALNEHGESNWPERWPTHMLLERQRLDPLAFASQYQMDPVDMADNPLKREWLRLVPQERIPLVTTYFGIDPSPSGRAGTDYFSMAIIGLHHESDTRYLLEAVRVQIEPLEQVALIRSKAVLYRPALILIEAVSAQQLFTRYFFNDAPALPIREAKSTNIPKGIRYAAMSAHFSSGRVVLKAQVDQVTGELVPADSLRDFVTEWEGWNDRSNRDDTLDAVGKAIEASGLCDGVPAGVTVNASPASATTSDTARMGYGSMTRAHRIRDAYRQRTMRR